MGIYDEVRRYKQQQLAAANPDPNSPIVYHANKAVDPRATIERGASREAGRMTGMDANADASRGMYMDLISGGQNAFETSARAAIEAAMPSFRQQLQGARSSAIARGVSSGETGMFGEREVFDAFERNASNAIAGQALGVYGTRLGASGDLAGMDASRADSTRGLYYGLVGDLHGAARERDMARRQQKAQKYNLFGQALGVGAGLYAGGR